MGYVLTGSLVGALGGPVLMTLSQGLAITLAVHPLAMPWFLIPAVILPSMALVFLVRPDPKEIAANLSLYYPGHALVERRADAGVATGTSFQAFVAHYPKRVAFVCSFATQGTMTMMMAMTSLALSHHGHGLPSISLAVALHVVGMYGLSIPMGRLTDRFGRRIVMLAGLVVTFASSVVVAVTPDYWTITLGTFLVGVGWSCVNVAAAALIADTTGAHERGRAVGTNDTFTSAASIAMPLLAGPFVAVYGLGVLGVITLVALAPPTAMLLRLRELSPGHYAD
jgi:Na+/melibiose symporter-like transporter